ncbi:hypothetical protein PGT21_025486 [Puccinia graminis f. sp. tritici]|uniref:Uncharacterized protein n=1 Tax=Puccinia graminis f. sp. tritici TaxID=56615 RepID=A0A5B0MNP3_PUCGR|nr:hypothetical protein PGT21_025486 [Puccinia graminis f. sp. tritici]
MLSTRIKVLTHVSESGVVVTEKKNATREHRSLDPKPQEDTMKPLLRQTAPCDGSEAIQEPGT